MFDNPSWQLYHLIMSHAMTFSPDCDVCKITHLRNKVQIVTYEVLSQSLWELFYSVFF